MKSLCSVASLLPAYGLVRGMQGLSKDPASVASASAGAAQPREPEFATGARLFDNVGCAKCHVPALSGVSGDVTLYSDLLLHDMGAALDDKIVQGEASGAEWRTTPLVGIGARERFLHDGRATSLHDAVLAHGGEGEVVRRRLFEMSEAEQREVERFVASR